MTSINENKPLDPNAFIDHSVGNTVQMAKPEDDGKAKEEADRNEKLSQHRKELKKHHKMLMEKAEGCYDKGDKELGKKYLAHAKKLSEDMDDETKELKMSDYDIDEASLGSEKVKELSKAVEDLTIKFEAAQNEIATLKLGKAPSVSPEDFLTEMKATMDKYQSLLEGVK